MNACDTDLATECTLENIGLFIRGGNAERFFPVAEGFCSSKSNMSSMQSNYISYK